MHRDMSYRKPVPPFIPSPPPSPISVSVPRALSAGRQEEIPPLPDHWHDAIAQAHRTCDNYLNLFVSPTSASPSPLQHEDTSGGSVCPETLTVPIKTTRELPRFASPVYIGTTRVGQHRLYRPPTPPRGHKRPRLYESQNASEASVGPKHAKLPSRRSDGMYAWSIRTMESYSRHASSISLPDTEWQLAQLPIDTSAGETEPVWWRKIKTLGVMIVNRLKGVKEYGPLC
ncbi:hypothetical protein DFH09DRAFT_1271677 [Mycena vulgaris]|nr:hypothetical protein DFH09DRAFT_1271677 [Mycena vulgaris]